jgi:hypothetical protein
MRLEPIVARLSFSGKQLLAYKPCTHAIPNELGANGEIQCNFTVGLVCLVIMRDRVKSVVLRMP